MSNYHGDARSKNTRKSIDQSSQTTFLNNTLRPFTNDVQLAYTDSSAFYWIAVLEIIRRQGSKPLTRNNTHRESHGSGELLSFYLYIYLRTLHCRQSSHVISCHVILQQYRRITNWTIEWIEKYKAVVRNLRSLRGFTVSKKFFIIGYRQQCCCTLPCRYILRYWVSS